MEYRQHKSIYDALVKISEQHPEEIIIQDDSDSPGNIAIEIYPFKTCIFEPVLNKIITACRRRHLGYYISNTGCIDSYYIRIV